jgi:hypothetical protein
MVAALDKPVIAVVGDDAGLHALTLELEGR